MKLRPVRRVASAVAAVLLAGCAAAPPTRFHTLLDEPVASAAPRTAQPPAWELLPVSVPAQVDQPQLVVRAADGTLALLERERWIAPLADEIHAALTERLAQAFGPAATAGARPAWRIRVEVKRFDSAPGRYARLDVAWTLLRAGGDAGPATLSCRGSFEQAVGPGFPALAAGHRQAVGKLADAITAALAAGQPASCP